MKSDDTTGGPASPLPDSHPFVFEFAEILKADAPPPSVESSDEQAFQPGEGPGGGPLERDQS